MKIPSSADPAVQEAFRAVHQRIDGLSARDVDMHGRRIFNAGGARQGQEYMTRRQMLDELQALGILDRTASVVIQGGGGGGSFGTHGLLSPTHSDSNAAGAIRGDLIVGNSASLWSRLAVGAAATFLGSNGTDPSWSAVGWSDNGTIIAATTGRDLTTHVTANGAALHVTALSENIVLGPSQTTDSTADLLTANSVPLMVVARVTSNILRNGSAASSYHIGDAGSAARFVNASTGVSAGSTAKGWRQWRGSVTTDADGPSQSAAAKIRITVLAGAGISYAGEVRVTVFALTSTAPTS